MRFYRSYTNNIGVIGFLLLISMAISLFGKTSDELYDEREQRYIQTINMVKNNQYQGDLDYLNNALRWKITQLSYQISDERFADIPNHYEDIQALMRAGATVDKNQFKYFHYPSYSEEDRFISDRGIDEYSKIIKFLVENGADINAKIDSKKLILPVYDQHTHGKLAIFKLFVDSGGKYNPNDTEGLNQICKSSFDKERIEIIDYLLKNGTDINNGNNCLLYAIELAQHNFRNYQKPTGSYNREKYLEGYNNDIQFAQYLIDKGAHIDEEILNKVLNNIVWYSKDGGQATSGYPPLSEEELSAIRKNSLEIAQILIQQGAKLTDLLWNRYNEHQNIEEISIILAQNPKSSIAFEANENSSSYFKNTMLMIIGVWVIIALAFVVIKKIASNKKEKRRLKLKTAFLKLKIDAKNISDTLASIDTSFLPKESEIHQDLSSNLQMILSNLSDFEGKEDMFDIGTALTQCAAIEKQVEELKKAIEEKNAELSKIKSALEKYHILLGEILQSMRAIRNESLRLSDFPNTMTYMGKIQTIISEAELLDEKYQTAKTLDMMRQLLGTITQIDSLKTSYNEFYISWHEYQIGHKYYAEEIEQLKVLNGKAELYIGHCKSIANHDSALSLLSIFSAIAEKVKETIALILSNDKLPEITSLQTQNFNLWGEFKKAEDTFNEKFKSLAEFKSLITDRAKKEWILENGHISWFFNDPMIAEKFKEFDPLEEKFKYLLQASEKLRFLDLDPREEKTTWPVFMQEISSDMSYDELSKFMKQWQTSEKFKKIKENWQKKLNESNTEEKKLLQITSKFVNIRF